jgi:hypothetical protein
MYKLAQTAYQNLWVPSTSVAFRNFEAFTVSAISAEVAFVLCPGCKPPAITILPLAAAIATSLGPFLDRCCSSQCRLNNYFGTDMILGIINDCMFDVVNI